MKQLKYYLMVAVMALSFWSCDKSDKVSSETRENSTKKSSADKSIPMRNTMAVVDGHKISVKDFEEAKESVKVQYGKRYDHV